MEGGRGGGSAPAFCGFPLLFAAGFCFLDEGGGGGEEEGGLVEGREEGREGR